MHAARQDTVIRVVRGRLDEAEAVALALVLARPAAPAPRRAAGLAAAPPAWTRPDRYRSPASWPGPGGPVGRR
ncbi:acyl-CoA carboxylase epsilon subunit [Allonocardiopsis opalescens]|uniref:Acyl-CoA carboxylase epsilon subunit-like protein n=1 Tax=Allonocardiopsis opalescens TaxID=1144618 RepID=A0A2T0PQ23_9ACTN|nr:acyl-CoA carboxylase epsilon subunit [Allonocardiopsis opalescens]PRX90908.1 acyl-CoA carboxylase epsilon subunit-like protein [Allonocardiopsis opalescens]